MPWVERADVDGDGAEELGVGWNSFAGEAGAAGSQGAAGLSCPAGMVLDGGLCKTPKVEHAAADLVCPQADDGYVLVTALGELGPSHSCQKTVPAHCAGGKTLHEGQCRTVTVEQRDAKWKCSQGTLVSTFLDPGYSYSCRITVDPPQCTVEGESYRTTPAAGCYEQVEFHETRGYTWECSEGVLQVDSGDHGIAYSCKVTLASPTCPAGETYRNGRCETQETYYRTRGYTWTCSEGTRVTTSGDHGTSYSCRITLSPPTCPTGETYRNGRCEEQETYYRTRGYTWTCSEGTRVTTSGDHGTSYSCRITLSPPTCPNGETYRSNGCYEQESYYGSRPLRYSCPSGYTLKTSGLSRSCTKKETYRKRRCAFDPFAGQQCWWETLTRTLTAAVIESCPAGYSPDGVGCTADRPSTRWKPTGSTPTRYRHASATRSCPSGWSPSGSVCQSGSPSTRWKRTGSTPTRYRYTPATKSCPSGWSDNGALCESDTASTRWKVTGSTPTRHRYDPAAKSCPAGWSDNGALCESDTAKQRWDRTASVPVTSRTADAVRFCDTGFSWNDSSGKCEKTLYSDPTAPLTKLVGQPPTQSCPDGWDPAGGGQCSRTTLGDPTRTPTGAACVDHLGILKAGTVTRSGTLGAGCVSLREGDKQSPHWARRFSLSVAAASKATLVASSSAADTFLYVLSGSGSDVTEEGSDDDSGDGTDAKITGIALAPDITYTVEVTTPTANVTGAFTLTVTIAPDLPPVEIVGLADAYDIGQTQAAPSDDFTVEPATAACTVTPPDAKITAGNGANRTVSLTRKPPFSQEVTVKCAAAGRSESTAKATLTGHQAIAGLTVTATGCKAAAADSTADYECTVPADGAATLTGTAQGPASALSLSWAASGDAKIDSQSQAKTQIAAPSATPVVYSRTGAADISCTADGTATLTATAGAHSRAVTIAVACGQPPPDVECDDPLGTLPEGTTSRSGTITPDAGCTTAHRGRAGTYHTRRHTFTLSGPAQVTVDVGNDPANTAKLDTYLILLDGHGTAGKVSARDDDGGPSTDSRIAKKLPPGDYTVEATTYRSAAAGRYRLTAEAVHDRKAAIAGLADTTETGLGEVIVTAPFTVTPAAADCTASPATATVAAGTSISDRIVTAGVAAPGSLAVTVNCTAPGHAAATQTVTLTAELATGVITIGARAADGGECKTVTPVPDGADAAYICTMAQGGGFEIEAEATATATALTVAWAASGGAIVDSQSQGTVTATVGPDGTVLYRRTATATLNCTVDGTATATAALGDSTKTAHLTVNCLTPVAVTGLADTAETGVGQVAVTVPFTVEPATARCTASPAAATVTEGTNPADRTLTADIAAPGSLAVTVTCEADSYADTTQAVTLTAKLAASVTTIGARAIDGGDCKAADTVPDGADVAYTCTMARGEDFEIEAEATATGTAIAVSWTTTGGVTVKTQTQGTATAAVGPDGTVLYRRTATAALNCTTNGTATATAALGASTKTAHLTVNCLTPVTISGLADTAKTGTGQVTVTAPFTVTPATAACTTEPSTASVAEGSNGRRTLTAKLDAPGSLAVTVTCRRDGWAATSQTVTLTAALPCGDHLGLLRSGRTNRSGAIAADAACTTTHRGSGTFYVRRHTFTMGSPGWVTVNLKNANGQYSTRLDTYLILLKGTGATATVIDEDDDDGHRNDSRLTDIFLQPGTYTIEATTYRPGHTGHYRLDVNATVGVVPCTEDLGKLEAGRYVRTGTVAAVPGCVSSQRGRIDSRPKSRWYTFTLDAPAWVDIDLAKTSISSLNPYLLLLSGHDPTGTAIEQDDDSGTDTAAQIQGRHLEAGTYTIETTAAASTGTVSTGDFTLTVTVPIHGLAATNTATVDQQTTLTFNYWPANADIAARSEDLALATAASNGGFTMVLSPDRARNHAMSVHMGVSAAANSGMAAAARSATTRSAQQSVTTRTFPAIIDSQCHSGMVVSPINLVLCVASSDDSDPRLDDVDDKPLQNPSTKVYADYDGPYEVTVGALLGTRDAARAAVGSHTMSCTNGRLMGVHELTALMLAIGFWENPNPQTMLIGGKPEKDVNMRFPARSLMTLSRKDHLWTPVEEGDDNSLLYSYNSLARQPRRAFWHPGVGMWQIDKFASPDLNHGQRADTGFGGVRVAERLLAESCDRTHSHQRDGSFERWLEGTWKACEPSDAPLTTKSQCLRTRDNIWMNNGTRDDLFVTVRDNARDTSRTGGVGLFECRWSIAAGGTEMIDGGHPKQRKMCYFYDTDYAEGSLHNYAPLDGDLQRRSGPPTNSSSPYAVPFVSFTDDGTRFAVFPGSFLGGHSSTPIKTVPDDTLVRRHRSLSWHTDNFKGKVLQLRLCRIGALFAPPECAWVSAAADGSDPGGSFASWIAAARG